MANTRTTIEWTDATWSPITGCTKVSPGCANCYIVRTMPFRVKGRKFQHVGNEMTTGVILHTERLEQPLKWRKPQRIFVNSMSDLFHEDVPYEFIAGVFAVMAASQRHTFQILTKRPERALTWFDWFPSFYDGPRRTDLEVQSAPFLRKALKDAPEVPWPLPNVHLYVTVENQYWADQRIPLLLQMPAAVHGVSYEPALKAVDFREWLRPIYCQRPDCPEYCFGEGPNCGAAASGLSHIIMGGESGPKARPMHPDWVRSTRDQCIEAGVPFFFKQWGEWIGVDQIDGDDHMRIWQAASGLQVETPRKWDSTKIRWFDHEHGAVRVGKKAAGAMLDGREWREMPKETVTARTTAQS